MDFTDIFAFLDHFLDKSHWDTPSKQVGTGVGTPVGALTSNVVVATAGAGVVIKFRFTENGAAKEVDGAVDLTNRHVHVTVDGNEQNNGRLNLRPIAQGLPPHIKLSVQLIYDDAQGARTAYRFDGRVA